MAARRIITVGSLFSGAGGMDAGFRAAGLATVWMCERDTHCRKLLAEKFPGVPVYPDVTRLFEEAPVHVDIIAGGDPCPAHSVAKGDNESVHPDLSGYFLAVVAGLAPKWVVRENVPSPVTIDDFAVALEALGYSTAVVWANAAACTTQNRERSFVVGCSSTAAFRRFLSHAVRRADAGEQMLAKRGIFNCLTSSRQGPFNSENLVYEEGLGLRPLDPDERDFVTGFPPGWTAGFPTTVRRRMCGNAVVPPVAEALAVKIIRASRGISKWDPPDPEAGVRMLRARFLV